MNQVPIGEKGFCEEKKLGFNFEIMFCSIFIREVMAEKSKKKGRRARAKIALKIFGSLFRQYNPNFF